MLGYDHRDSYRNPHVHIPDDAPELAWKADIRQPRTLTVGPDRVVVGGGSTGKAVGLSLNGKRRWTVGSNVHGSLSSAVPSRPVLGGDRLYLNDEGVEVYHRIDGSHATSMSPPTEPDPQSAQPVLANGRVYSFGGPIASFDGDGDLQWYYGEATSFSPEIPPAVAESGFIAKPSNRVRGFADQVDPWQGFFDTDPRVPEEQGKRWEGADAYREPLVADGRAFMPAAYSSPDEDAPDVFLRARSAATGDVRWHQALQVAEIAYLPNTLVVAQWDEGLVGLNPVTGTRKWETPTRDLDGESGVALIAGADSLLYGRAPGVVEHWRTPDSPEWRLDVGSVQELALTQDRLFALVGPEEESWDVYCYEWSG